MKRQPTAEQKERSLHFASPRKAKQWQLQDNGQPIYGAKLNRLYKGFNAERAHHTENPETDNARNRLQKARETFPGADWVRIADAEVMDVSF